jgi:CHASE2 domain-containing sensor protein
MSAQLPAQGIDVFESPKAPAEDWTARPRPRRKIIGGIAFFLAILAWVADGLAVGIATGRNDQLSTSFVIGSICASILALGGGLFAFLTGRGRLFGIVGAVLGTLANPFVLIAVLEFFARFSTN